MRVLYITNRQRTGDWLAEAFAADSASEVVLEEATGSAAGLSRLRDEAFDAVLASHEPGELDALALIEGYRAGGADEPIVVLGNQSEQEMAALCFEVGADGYVCAHTTTTRNLIWIVARAIQRHRLIRANRRLNLAERQRLQREHDEAERLLLQQRAMISDLEAIRQKGSGTASPGPAFEPGDEDRPAESGEARRRAESRPPTGLPGELVHHYRELLRTYVIMGSGNLAAELSRLAEVLTTAGVSPRQAMHLHLHVLEELVHGLGARSTRHVMTRADLLVLEIMIHLAEGYRQRYQERVHPPVQRVLPGFAGSLRMAS
jgi:DNA-binding NarL/FixJ family response regulator